jgi:hypothetical protein
LPRNVRRRAGLRASLRCLLRYLAELGNGKASLGKKSWKTTDQLPTIRLASFQQFFATPSDVPNEHYSSEAKDRHAGEPT